MKYVLASLAVLGLIACAESPSSKPPPPTLAAEMPYKLTVCHVGSEFDVHEKAHLRNAGSAWALFSEYHANISSPDDLDFNNNGKLAPCTVQKLPGNHRLVKAVDEQLSKGLFRVQAFTIGQRVYFIDGRYTPEEFPWLAIHEYGHVLGLDDLDEMGHVMSRVASHGKWFDDADTLECRRVRVCP